jgi:parvulin-like peptidyl-prolyl isomerase
VTKKLVTVIGLAMVIALAGCGKREDVVATVGGEKITMAEFKDALMQKFRSEENIRRKGLDERQKVVREIAINDAKYQEGLARKIDQRPDVKQEIESLAKRKALDYLYQEKVVNAVLSDAKIREFYDKSGEEIRARHILLKTTPVDTSATDTLKVKARIDSIKKAIDKGLDFKAAAKMFSEDATSAADSGNLDWFGWGRMVDEFQQAAWNANTGEMVGPVRTQFGYHLIRVEERRKVANRKPYEEQKEQIKNQLREAEGQKMNDTARDYLEKLRVQRGVKYNDATLTEFRQRVSDPTVTKTMPLDPFFTEEQKKMVAATYDKDQVTVADLLEKLGGNAGRVQWDDAQAVKDLVNAVIEPKLLEEEGERLGLVKKAMDDKEVVQQKRQAVVRILEKEEVSDKINPKEEDEQAFYQNHLQNYIQSEQRTVREIFVKTDSAKVAGLRARALKGENFKKLTLKYNEKESTKVDTGRLGPFEQKRFGLIGNAAFQLQKIGDVSDVVANGKNYSVIQLMDIIPSRTKSFDEARQQASREYRMARTDDAQKALETMLLEKYRLKIQEDKLARAYPMAEQPAAAKPDTAKKG